MRNSKKHNQILPVNFLNEPALFETGFPISCFVHLLHLTKKQKEIFQHQFSPLSPTQITDDYALAQQLIYLYFTFKMKNLARWLTAIFSADLSSGGVYPIPKTTTERA